MGNLFLARDDEIFVNRSFIFWFPFKDAGKSTISGNVLYLTGMVDSRTIEKYQREAKEKNRGTWFLAFIMDTNEEERAKVMGSSFVWGSGQYH